MQRLASSTEAFDLTSTTFMLPRYLVRPQYHCSMVQIESCASYIEEWVMIFAFLTERVYRSNSGNVPSASHEGGKHLVGVCLLGEACVSMCLLRRSRVWLCYAIIDTGHIAYCTCVCSEMTYAS